MTYKCAIGPGIPGMDPDSAHILCDGCGLRLEASKKGGIYHSWLLDGRPAKGWLLIPHGKYLREDYCPECRAKEMNLHVE